MFRKLLLVCAFACAPFIARAQPVDQRNPAFPGAGIVVGTPTGGNLGPGTVNATGIFVDGNSVGGGLAVPNNCVIGGNGSTLTGVTLGANLTCSSGVLTAAGAAPGGSSGQVQINNGAGGLGALPTGTAGASIVLQTGSNGLIDPSTLPIATTSAMGGFKPDGATIVVNPTTGFASAVGAAATSMAVGTTTVGGGQSGQLLLNNNGVLGNVAVSSLTGLTVGQISGLGTGATANTGTSGATLPLLNGTNTWANPQTFSGGLIGSVTGHASLDLPLSGGTLTGNLAVPAVNGWAPQFITAWNSNGAPVAGGSGYVVGDLVTLSDGTVVAIGTVSGSVVTGYFVSTPATVSSLPAQPLAQASTTGSGSGATFNIKYVPASWGNVFEPQGGGNGSPMTAMGLGSYYGAKGHPIGNTWYGNGTGGGAFTINPPVSEGLGGCTGIVSTGESTGLGFQAGGCLTTGLWITATGTGAGEHEYDGGSSEYYATDSGKYAIHNNSVDANGISSFKFVENATHDVALGDTAFEGGEVGAVNQGPSITGAADNGSGLIRLTLSTTTGITSGDAVFINSVAGTTEANTNGTPWYVTVIDGTHIDLQGSTFTNAYVSSPGKVLDFPASFINLAITNITNNGAGLIRVFVPNTFNITVGTASTAHISGVVGTTEANGTWTISNPEGPFCVTGCYVDLVGSTFTNAYVSGGQMTVLQGPRESIAAGTAALGSANLTGGIINVTALGAFNSGSAKSMGMVTSVGSHVGQTTLGNGGANFGVFLGGVDITTDVVSNTVQDAVGIGRSMKLCNECVLFGSNVGRIFSSSAEFNDISGYDAGFGMVAPTNVTAHGFQVGNTNCVNPSNVLLLGTNFRTDCASANETYAIHIGAGQTDIITASGTSNPAGSTLTLNSGIIVLPNAIAANGTTSVSLTALAPTGAHATVQEWLKIKDGSGNVVYIPTF